MPSVTDVFYEFSDLVRDQDRLMAELRGGLAQLEAAAQRAVDRLRATTAELVAGLIGDAGDLKALARSGNPRPLTEWRRQLDRRNALQEELETVARRGREVELGPFRREIAARSLALAKLEQRFAELQARLEGRWPESRAPAAGNDGLDHELFNDAQGWLDVQRVAWEHRNAVERLTLRILQDQNRAAIACKHLERERGEEPNFLRRAFENARAEAVESSLTAEGALALRRLAGEGLPVGHLADLACADGLAHVVDEAHVRLEAAGAFRRALAGELPGLCRGATHWPEEPAGVDLAAVQAQWLALRSGLAAAGAALEGLRAAGYRIGFGALAQEGLRKRLAELDGEDEVWAALSVWWWGEAVAEAPDLQLLIPQIPAAARGGVRRG